MKQDYAYYLNANMKPYIGEWVAIVDKKVVAHGKDAKKVYDDAVKKTGGKRPLIARIPDKETMIL